jgi:D-alanyl-D-alanine carboxypeptidase
MSVKAIARGLCVVTWLMTLLAGLVSVSSQQSAASSREEALDKAMPAAMTRASIPGAIVGVWQDGREPYVRAFGVRDTATGQPMTTGSADR